MPADDAQPPQGKKSPTPAADKQVESGRGGDGGTAGRPGDAATFAPDTPGAPDDEAAPEAGIDTPADDNAHNVEHDILVRRDPKMRLDQYLQNRLKGISRSRIQRLIESGAVTLNDRAPKASAIIRQGDRIHVVLPPPAVQRIDPEPMELDILYEDDDLVVINKTAGVIVHPARGNTRGTLINGLAWHMKQQLEAEGTAWKAWTTTGTTHRPGAKARSKSRKVKGLSEVGAEELRPGVVHRLDQYTTGCIVFARSDWAHWRLARQFERRQTLKAYLALVHGNFDHGGDVIDQPIGKHPTIREAFAVRHDSMAKDSVTLYRVREQYPGYSLVELELKTGRTHQIRVHLSYLGHPIVGDVVYGGEPLRRGDLDNPPIPAAHRRYLNCVRTKEEGLPLLHRAMADPETLLTHPALHAALLSFTHPRQQETVCFTAPVHEPVRSILAELRTRRIDDAPVADAGTYVDLDSALPPPDRSA